MFDIKCKRTECEFNKNCNCNAKDLEIAKNTLCKTFSPSQNSSKNEESKIGQPAIRKNIIVSCKANCLFNQEQMCLANGIFVRTLENESCPNCCTYKSK
jgi:hypothetical protein